ncbi:hypothetical protein KP79_PYT09877 [Mizuhopecten yessoensis]|uniref:Uncharacterized protein n=1 Tax=Mizuhopecten yessoensis TaxID=6573 RepID=A0A210PW20_MIZYE|nr:hypothetical protein KP79_PYT09877 [Mizuhopecten yessoensis]
MANVVVIGHSFVKRLDRALEGSWTNLGFHDDPTNIVVSFVGKSGGRLPDVYVREVTDRLREQIADLVLLQIGGNDLDCARIEDAKDSIVNNLLSIVEWLASGLSVVGSEYYSCFIDVVQDTFQFISIMRPWTTLIPL